MVALEIKSLSERISGATREINDWIGAICAHTSEAAAGTSAISEAVAPQNAVTQDIATSVDVTAGRSSQMADTMRSVDRVVAEIAGSSREVADAAEALQS